jgi:two-component system response regulator VanR
MVMLIVSYLKDMGVERIFCATHGRAALDILNDPGKSVDMVLYDWGLPGFSGLEALKSVREHFGPLPFLMLSPSVTREALTDAARHRVDGYLAKPFSVQLLERRIVALCRALPYGRNGTGQGKAEEEPRQAGDDAWVI